MLIAEDLLLLLTDDDSGKLVVPANEADVALGGAMLVELAALRRVDVAEPGGPVRKGTVEVLDRAPTGDPVLDEAVATVSAKEGKRPQDVVTALGRKLRPTVYARLTERGVVRAEHGKVLGIFPTTRWPAVDAAHEEEVRVGLVSALRNGLASDERTAALVSLLHALGAVHKAVDPATAGLTKGQMRDNAKRVAEADWVSAAVRKAIESMRAALVVATTSGSSAGGS